jgi:hypothetical protein
VTKAAAALGVFIHQEQSSTHGLMWRGPSTSISSASACAKPWACITHKVKVLNSFISLSRQSTQTTTIHTQGYVNALIH